jgi:DNA invertase Pin-like site-specific DNA recombinase
VRYAATRTRGEPAHRNTANALHGVPDLISSTFKLRAPFERSIIQERVRAGLARARKEGKRLGRPSIDPELEERIREALKDGMSVHKTAALHGVDPGTVMRVKHSFAVEGTSVVAA